MAIRFYSLVLELFNSLLIFCVFNCSMPYQESLASEKELPQVRVVTYNIHHAQGTDGRIDYSRIANIIKQLKPDLVSLQEVDKQTKRVAGVDQAKRIAKLTGLHYVFGSSMEYSGGQYGNAVLSRFPIKSATTHKLPNAPKQEPRSALIAEVSPDNGLPPLYFVSTHFCHLSNDTRTKQAQRLIELMSEIDQDLPIILAGDLNAVPQSDPIEYLARQGWKDAIAPQPKIDYVLYQSARPWRFKQIRIIDDLIASDHKPVLTVLQWKQPTGK